MGAGRPTKMTDITVKKLEEAFAMGCSDSEACLFADISKQTLYDYCKRVPTFTDRKELLKSNPILKAKKVLLGALDNGDEKIAQWYVDKKEGKARQAVELTGEDGGAIKTDNRFVVEFIGVDGVDKKDEQDSDS